MKYNGNEFNKPFDLLNAFADYFSTPFAPDMSFLVIHTLNIV